MTRFWLDTEFIEDGSTIDLISIGIVSSDGREYYAQSCEYDPRKASDWVRENVLAHLVFCPNYSNLTDSQPFLHRHGQCLDAGYYFLSECPWRTRDRIKHEVLAFINTAEDKPEFWGWITSYDHVALTQLFGTMMDFPCNWPHYTKDLQYILDERGISDDELPEQEGTTHNALEDARHLAKLWGYIVRNDAWQ